LNFQAIDIETYNTAFSELLQIDPREDFLSYLDQGIFFQQHYDDFRTSDSRVESERSEQEHKAPDLTDVKEKAADAEEQEEMKEGGAEEKKEHFGNAIRSEAAKRALSKLSEFGEVQANDLCAPSSEDRLKLFDTASSQGVSFREVVHLLRQNMENNVTREREAEMQFQVKYFANILYDPEEVPLVFLVRLVETKTGHQMLTFTDVSLTKLQAQNEVENHYQDLLVGSLGHE